MVTGSSRSTPLARRQRIQTARPAPPPEAELARVAVDLVDAEVRLPLGRPLGHDVVDGLRLLGRVERVLRLEVHLPAERDARLPILGDPLAGLDRLRRHRLPARL